MRNSISEMLKNMPGSLYLKDLVVFLQDGGAKLFRDWLSVSNLNQTKIDSGKNKDDLQALARKNIAESSFKTARAGNIYLRTVEIIFWQELKQPGCSSVEIVCVLASLISEGAFAPAIPAKYDYLSTCYGGESKDFADKLADYIVTHSQICGSEGWAKD